MAKAHRPTSSNKRIPVEAESSERMTIATTSAFQGSVGAEVTTKTLQDLPTELMEGILMKAVVAEVRDRNQAKSARNEAKSGWKQDAGRVISKLRKVCSRWSEILTTKRFQLELQRHLGTPPLHLEIVAKHPIDSAVAVTTMKNEIFVLCHSDEPNALDSNALVNVYDRNDLWKVKHVIQCGVFDEGKPTNITACSRMDCLFMMSDCSNLIYAIEKSREYEYWIIPLTRLEIPIATSTLAISAKESLVVTATGPPSFIQYYRVRPNSICNLQWEVRLREDVLSMSKVIQKWNGNFFFESLQSDHVRRLAEIDTGGYIVQQRRLPLCEVPCYDIDMCDRIMMAGPRNNVRMLDDQFQDIQVFAPEDLWSHPSGLHYDQEADEWMLIDEGKCLTVVTVKQGKTTHDDNTDFA